MLFAVSVVLIFAPFLATPVWAQNQYEEGAQTQVGTSDSSDYDEGEAQKAVRYFEQGDTAYQSGDYTTALSLFLRAHKKFPEAAFLYNAARSAQRLGRWEQARSLALRAKEQKIFPLSDGLSRATTRLLEEVEAEIEKEELRAQEAASRGLDWRGWTGLGAATAGTASIIIGLAVYGQQAQEHNETAGAAQFRPDYDAAVADMKQAQSTGWAFVGTGAVLAAAGLGLFLWDVLDAPDETRPTDVSIGLRSDGGDVSLRWSW